jgi:hypothetical protein
MSGIVITVIVAAGLIGLFIGLRGSFHRDVEFERRYVAATPEEKLKLDAIRPRSSWRWLNLHSTSRRWSVAWVIAFILCGLVAVGLKWGGH